MKSFNFFYINLESSARSWADTVKGRRYTLSHASMENMRRAQEDEEEEEGWSKVGPKIIKFCFDFHNFP